MTLIGIDDTDSRTRGMCTTFVAARVAERIRETGGNVERLLLVRCNPAVKHKTRGNAAVAIHTDFDPEEALAIAEREVERAAEVDDPNTNPGVVVAPHGPETIPGAVSNFSRAAVRDHLAIENAEEPIERFGYESRHRGNGRGRIGALAAIGAYAAFDEWTYELIAYREPDRWGTDRVIEAESVFAAAEAEYPTVWDTVDRGTGDVVCVPRTPCPVLYGIRGDDPDACRRVATNIEGEPVAETALFETNQGTDAHLRDGTIATAKEGRCYRVTGAVSGAPETREGGHVFFEIADGGDDTDDSTGDEASIRCAAFEPTKRFRNLVRRLRPGDRITACGEVGNGTLKLEKFAVRELLETEPATPACPECDRSMESAGREQGYRCRDCGTEAPGKVERPIDRELEVGWYEVPPSARRHVAKPLVRGGFDAPVHPER